MLAIPAPLGSYSAQERVARVAQKLLLVARDRRAAPESITLTDTSDWTEIRQGNQVLMVVSDADAKAASKDRHQLAAEDQDALRRAVIHYRARRSWEHVLEGLLYAVLATLALILLLWGLSAVRRRAERRLQRWIEEADRHLRPRSRLMRPSTYLARPLAISTGAIYWALILVLVEIYVTTVLGFFPASYSFSLIFTNWVLTQLKALGAGFAAYLPNLVLVLGIALITWYALRFTHAFFNEVEAGRITLPGFYTDWALPTSNLIRVMILMLGAIVVFPYLPGSKSPAFQGVSIFLGVLLSLGSSSAVANAVAGTILTYMRAFHPGDWVQIGEVTGEIVERSLLVTRIRTPRNEIITIPNGSVMGGSVRNYSALAASPGVIFHTTVTIGYDVPWRTVHPLLLAAAKKTSLLLAQPEPFVLQTALDDFYVRYELNAYTATPSRMAAIYSELHQNIQDEFNAAGVEIMSPHYAQLRDGNATTIPAGHLPPDYTPPSFRVSNTPAAPQK